MERIDVTSPGMDRLTPAAQQGVLAVPMRMRLCDYECNRKPDVTIGRIKGCADGVTSSAKLLHGRDAWIVVARRPVPVPTPSLS